jgi:hypothetical protein
VEKRAAGLRPMLFKAEKVVIERWSTLYARAARITPGG